MILLVGVAAIIFRGKKEEKLKVAPKVAPKKVGVSSVCHKRTTPRRHIRSHIATRKKEESARGPRQL
ncbi:MAG: hypothetical protein ACK5NW_06905 [Ottowia sp.]